MISAKPTPLLVGEVYVDFTLTPQGEENKLRLGGIAHAARGFWASQQPYRAAVVIPTYLEPLVRDYFAKCGCVDLTVIGVVEAAPNITLIYDAKEISDPQYETLLRDDKKTIFIEPSPRFEDVSDALIFPGTFDLEVVSAMLPAECRLHIDAAYDVASPDALAALKQPIETLFFSTSSPLFAGLTNGSLSEVVSLFSSCAPLQIVFKESRGGSQLFDSTTQEVHPLPAQLGFTENSVGVGDVFAAGYVTHRSKGVLEAGWRATRAAAAYSQTTVPDLFEQYVQRGLTISLEAMQELGGTQLPWTARRAFPIYFAAPDFADAERAAMDRALAALSYHNFHIRRPVQENGELPANSPLSVLRETYNKDCDLLEKCSIVFAVPTARDPGTLVEIGLAIASHKPVIVFDPARECANTMVIAGSTLYSSDLDECLNAVFVALAKLEAK